MERALVILIMLIGVNLFYFLVSNITTLISKKIKEQRMIKYKLRLLFGLMIKYKIPSSLIRSAKYALDLEKKDINLRRFSTNFGGALKRDLDYFYFWPVLKKFPFFSPLRKDIIASIGPNLKKVAFCRSKLVL